MKIKTVYLVLGLLVVFSSGNVLAQTRTASPSAALSPNAKPSTASATLTPEDKDVEAFKENVANKVAELRKKGLKAVAGNITKIDGKELEIKTVLDTTYTIKLDETLTKVYQIVDAQKKDLKQSDLKKDMYIIVSGPLLDKTITANVIYVDEQIVVKSGKITEVNTDDASLKIVTSERDNLVLDIPSRFKMETIDTKTLELGSITLSKIKEGDTVHFVYIKTGKEKIAGRFDAFKLLIIPQEYFQK